LAQGIGVGFAVAAPVGPIGILCIRRTLANGRAAGLATGLGAATADALYGVLVATGFAATGLLLSHAGLMQIGGGLLITLLGLLTLRKFMLERHRTDSGPAPQTPASGRRVFGDFATTFTLTMANPMTILIFVGLISGLGAGAPDTPAAPYLLVLGIFTGSALWWLGLVHVALALRTRLSPAATHWIDALSGTVLTVWGLWIVLAG
jgi:threonine/homoserine/homoserine lactone efflux protein